MKGRSGLESLGPEELLFVSFVNEEGEEGFEIGTRDASHAVVSTERLMAL